jgi:hypothetical protein
MVNIFTVLYGDFGQPVNGFTPYYNRAKSKLYRFENNAILDIVDKHLEEVDPNDWVGVFSPRFPGKTKCDDLCVMRGIRAAREYQAVNYSPYLGDNIAGRGWNFMEWSEDGHKGITEIIQACCRATGILYHPNPDHIVYANQFVARKSVYVDFVESVLRPSIILMEGELWNKVNVDPGYTRSVYGVQYNLLTFVCERLFMQYAQDKKIKVLEWN